MDERTESLNEEAFAGALRLAGWFFAGQAYVAEKGEIPMPLLVFLREGINPHVVAPRTKSEFYGRQVAAGRCLIADQCLKAWHWIFAYDTDLEDSGRALIVEVGGRGSSPLVTFAQRYILDGGPGLSLIGDLELVGEELLPPDIQASLDSCRWRYLLAEGASNHDLAGEHWPTWYSARRHGKAQLRLEEFSFVVPEGWFFRQTESGDGWLISRMLPLAYEEFEPVIIARIVTFADQATLEDVVEGKKSDLIDRGDEILREEVTRLPSHPLSARVGRLTWSGEREGRSFKAQWVWVPTERSGEFLLLAAISFAVESWRGLLQALEAVLASLRRTEGEVSQ